MRQADEAIARAAILLPATAGVLEAEGMEKTYRFKQSDIKQNVDVQSAAKSFDIKLEYGPYSIDFERNGRYVCSCSNISRMRICIVIHVISYRVLFHSVIDDMQTCRIWMMVMVV